MTMPVLILVGLVAAGCGQEECVPWIEEGGRYTVTVGEPTDAQIGRLVDRAHCGPAFDLEPGDRFTVIEAGPNFEGGPNECQFHDASFPDLPEVMLGDREGGGSDADHFLATGLRTAVIRRECEGSYQIGLVVHRRNLFVFREFFPREVEPCLVPGSELEGSDFGCADAWFAQVENAQGEVVAEFP
jgi:hypothetical protein